jgi:hypothetical protein
MVVVPAQLPFILSSTDGRLELQDAAGTVLDGISWEVAPAGASLVRGGDEWPWSAKATPGLANELVALPSEVGGSGQGEPGARYPAVEITELLPDPAAPASDATDEFIELHNPNSYEISLAGYRLVVGAAGTDTFVFSDQTLAPGAYAAYTSAQTGLALSNSGSVVRLLDPVGQQVGEAVQYGAAPSGQAWARFAEGWRWTTTPAPALGNVLSVAALATKAAKAKAAAKPKAKAAAGKVKAAKATKTPKAKKAAVKTKSAANKKPLVSKVTSGPWLIWLLIGLTICYCVYEFRYDLRSYYHRLRGYPNRGRAPRPDLEGWGDDRASQRPGRGQDGLRAGVGPQPRLQW